MDHAENHKPPFPPSYTVHVLPSPGDERGNFGSDYFWSLQGYTLKEAIDLLYDVSPIRIQLPASLDNDKHYDFALVLPDQESREKMKGRMRQGLQDYFQVSANLQNLRADVYVLTNTPDRIPPKVKPYRGPRMGSFGFSSMRFISPSGLEGMKPQTIGAIRTLSMDATVDEFCHSLESILDRPVVNETNLEGKFEFRVESDEAPENNFLLRLREQLGLVITPDKRDVETLLFERR